MATLRQRGSLGWPEEEWGFTPIFHGCQPQQQDPSALAITRQQHLSTAAPFWSNSILGFCTILPPPYGNTHFFPSHRACGFVWKEAERFRQILMKYVEHFSCQYAFVTARHDEQQKLSQSLTVGRKQRATKHAGNGQAVCSCGRAGAHCSELVEQRAKVGRVLEVLLRGDSSRTESQHQ